MSQRNIDFGTFPDDPSADAIRTAFQKTQDNFTQLFAGLQDQAVISVNQTSGAGIAVNSPTGNVIVSANIACVQVGTTTLSVSRDTPTQSPSAQATVITQSSQVLYVNLPTTIANVDNILLNNTITANTVNVNAQINGNIGNFSGNISASNANISGILFVAGNANVGNIGANNIVGTLTTASQPNITSVGTLGSLTVTANVTAGNVYSNSGIIQAQYLKGDGSNIANVVAVPGPSIVNGSSYSNIIALNGNIVSNVAGATVQVLSASGANITGYATVSGNLTSANANLGNLATANYFSGSGNNLSNIQGANVTGAVSYATTANAVAGANVSGAVSYATTANAVAGANVSGAVSYATTANSVAGANVSGYVANANIANTAYAVAGANVSGQVSYAAVANSVAGSNVSGQVGNALVAGTVYTNAQPNITSVGTLTSLGVNGTVTAVAFTANTGVFTGNGNGLSSLVGANVTGQVSYAATANAVAGANVSGAVSYATTANAVAGANVSGAVSYATTANAVAGANVSGAVAYATTANAVAGANVSGQVGNALVAGTVYTNAQPNITSVGTLSAVSITGNATAGNVYANSGIIGAQYLKGDGSNITNLTVSAGSTIVNGTSNVAVDASGDVRTSVAGTANVIVVTSTGANITGTANVSGNANVGNLGATGVVATTVAGNLTTAAQPNITSVGTLTGLTVNGTSNLGANGNVKITGGSSNQYLITDGTGNLTWTTSSSSPAAGSNAQVIFNDGGSTYAGNPGLTFNKANAYLAVTGNVSANVITANLFTGVLTTANQPNIRQTGALDYLIINSLNGGTGNLNAGNVIVSGVFQGNGSSLTNIPAGNVTGTLSVNTTGHAATVSNAAQSNITSVGTLTSLTTSGQITSTLAQGTAPFVLSSNTLVANLNADYLEGRHSVTTNTANTVVIRDANGSFSANIITATLSGAATTAGTVTTAAQPNITSVGTLTSLGVNGTVTAVAFTANTGVFTGNGNGLSSIVGANVTGQVSYAATANAVAGANVSGQVSYAATANAVAGANVSGQVGNALVAGTVYTNAQPNITSVGTLTSLGVNGTITGVNITANTGVFTGNGNGLSSLVGANVTGQVGNALVAGTVYTNAQPNITSVGTLTSLSSSGNIVAPNVQANTGYFIRSVATGISAAGSTQGTATAITKEINVVSTVSSGNGVVLPTAVAGMSIHIINTSANSLLVYPATNGIINSLSANAAFTHGAGATLTYLAPTTTQWYTVGATYA